MPAKAGHRMFVSYNRQELPHSYDSQATGIVMSKSTTNRHFHFFKWTLTAVSIAVLSACGGSDNPTSSDAQTPSEADGANNLQVNGDPNPVSYTHLTLPTNREV